MEHTNEITFSICAYKESAYLEDCIQSLLKQSVKGKIIICTSTPNAFIANMASKYSLPYFINDQAKGMASDWNFAASCVTTKYYTLCHQDDYYFEDYAKIVLQKIEKAKKDLLLIYTNYQEDKLGILENDNINLKIKRLMNLPMKLSFVQNSIWLRRRVFSLGNPICCPSVTFNSKYHKGTLFDESFKNAADWDAWERLSKEKGAIVYCKEYLMAHRVHEESTTTLNILNNVRKEEDLIMFRRFWPSFIARPLSKIFSMSEKNNG